MSGRCIAMWSGPRNISTAMMRAWENRADTTVIDEPFYAHFLSHTGLDHPMSEAVIARGNTDWRAVVEQLSTPPETGIFYQKHISTHWLEHFSTDWLKAADHVFLIRRPEAVVASYASKRGSMTTSDLGYHQQAFIFDYVKQYLDSAPLVIDSDRFLADPAAQLQKICARLEITFDECMLHWPAGSRDTDGLWGAHWYDAVNRSTGFGPPAATPPALNERNAHIASLCNPYYQAMLNYALE